MRTSLALCVFVAILHALTHTLVGDIAMARADCQGWLPGQGVAGVNGSVRVMTTWDPDGDGPAQEVLVAAGPFTFAGKTSANNIAIWNGQTWSALGGGITNGANLVTINALTVFRGKLIVGGIFSFPASNGTAFNIAQWDGAQWSSIGVSAASVTALGVYRDELIASGLFENIGDTAAKRLAAYNGVSWREFAGGLPSGIAYSFASDGDRLYVGGSFSLAGTTPVSNIASWDGTHWDNMEFGVLPRSSSVAAYRMLCVAGDLIVGGAMEYAGGNPVANVARWNGVFWQPMGDGLPASVVAISYFNGSAIAATSTGLYEWTGWVWRPLSIGGGANSPEFLSLASFDGALHAGGGLRRLAPDGYSGIARLEDSAWQSLGDGLVRTPVAVFASSDQRLYLGFNSPLDGPNLFESDGSTLTDPFAGANSYWKSVTVIGEYAGELVVAGRLSPRNSPLTEALTIARWRGGEWQRIGVSGGVYTGTVLAMTTYNGDLIIGGGFGTIDGQQRNSVARWDGIAWRAMGGTNNTVRALKVFQNKLIVGGDFTQAGTLVNAQNVAAWTIDGFQLLGGGLDSTVRAIEVFQGSIYAGGAFLRSGTAQVRGLARWTGSAWVSLGSTVPTVNSMVADDTELVIAGTFSGMPVSGSPRIHRWNGTSWAGFGSGMSANPTSIVRWNNEIVAIGTFTTAGSMPSWNFARWSLAGMPAFASIPSGTFKHCGTSAAFSASIVPGYGQANYSWKLNGNTISFASNPTAATATLVIDPVTHASDGIYECVVQTPCGEVVSPPATLVSSCCPPDLNYDSVVDDSDFAIFVIAYGMLVCDDLAMPAQCPSDLNRDGLVDDADFSIFLNGYDALECP